MEPTKHFVITPYHVDYDEIIDRYGLDPGRTFQCHDKAEAERNVISNMKCGIPCKVWVVSGEVDLRIDPWQLL